VKKLLLIVLMWSLAFTGSAQIETDAPIPVDPKIRTGVLPNGMKYYVRKNSKPEQRAELRLAVNAGSNFEEDNQQGIAHLTEHLAFNGTASFKKNELIDYLESVGTKFGPHLNAYTSFDETVYMLQIPTDKADIVDKGLQILEEWAHNLTFDSMEVQKERGVVVEEWRIGQGAGERMRRQYWPLLFKDSRYADRLPIGKKEIIESTPQSAIRAFYNDWYRPDLMAVIAVGDFDLDVMEKKIKDQFSKVPAKKSSKVWKSYDVPATKEMLYAAVTDKENTSSSIELLYKLPRETNVKINDFRDDIAKQLFSSMMNARLSEISRKADAPFLAAGGGFGGMVRTKSSFDVSIRCTETKFKTALNVVIQELERIRRHGFTQTELDRVKAEALDNIKRAYNERDKSPSAGFAREYVSNFLTNEPIPGIEKEYDYYNFFISQITLDEIGVIGKNYITGSENCFALITYPQKDGIEIPTEADIKKMFLDVKQADVTAYVDKVSTKPLIEATLKPAAIISEEKDEKYGITKWTFKNGVTVKVKPTDFNNDKIIFSSYSNGGWSTTARPDFYSAVSADAIVDNSGLGEFDATMLDKMLSGKTVSCSPGIGPLTQGLNGSCAPKDLSTMMELIYGYHTMPRIDKDAFSQFVEVRKTALKNKSVNPQAVYNDTVSYLMSGYHYAARPLTVELIDSINPDRALLIYKELMGDASGTNFYFVGNFNVDSLKEYVSKYIGNLPSSGTTKNWKDLGVRSPKGKINKTVEKGIAPKSYVSLRWNMDFEYSAKNRQEVSALNKLISIRLREVLREDKSGVYGVSYNMNPSRIPIQKLENTVGFSCKPENVDSLIDAVQTVIAEVKAKGCDDKNLEKIKQTFIRERETALKENSFWLSAMISADKNNEKLEEMEGYNAWVNSLTGKDFILFADKYFKTDNYARLVLMPE
jgi:zinc protease